MRLPHATCYCLALCLFTLASCKSVEEPKRDDSQLFSDKLEHYDILQEVAEEGLAKKME